MWDQLVVDPRYRCLIALTHFGNPDGVPGAKTRTWFSVEGQPILAWAGFCRNTPEHGPVYAGMTMEANAAIPPTNDRMSVLIEPRVRSVAARLAPGRDRVQERAIGRGGWWLRAIPSPPHPLPILILIVAPLAFSSWRRTLSARGRLPRCWRFRTSAGVWT